MSKIVYLFGAGASANALPIVKEMPERLEEIIMQIRFDNIEEYIPQRSSRKVKSDMIAKLEWLKDGCEKHATVDTFAKKLYLTDKDKYEELKRILSAYFALEQKLHRPDIRYDAFFASILGEKSSDLPKNISILSWNYDCQFELAYKEYTKEKKLNDIWQALSISTKKKQEQTVSYRFDITKLNGTALMEIDGNNILDPFYGTHHTNGIIDEIHHLYIHTGIASNVVNHLSFAWENDDQPDFYRNISSRVAGAEILVVIGYSFPYFNRKIDKFIFNSMNKLSKIYIQSPDADEVEQSMMTVLSNIQLHKPMLIKNIIKLPKTGQFYLPSEL